MKHTYYRYAALQENGETILQSGREYNADDGEQIWFNAWHFDPEIVDDCGYEEKEFLEEDLKRCDIQATIKKFKIVVELVD